MYLTHPSEVKKVIDAKLGQRPHKHEQFMYYHLYRNLFNVGGEIKTLRQVRSGIFRDNTGNTWNEVSTLKNFFHMPKTNWSANILTGGLRRPYSRKFLRPDDQSGLNGEFEMIIRHDGKRIDALTHEAYQETYNFGRTSDATAHKMLDVDPHMENPNYQVRVNTGWVLIIEEE